MLVNHCFVLPWSSGAAFTSSTADDVNSKRKSQTTAGEERGALITGILPWSMDWGENMKMLVRRADN